MASQSPPGAGAPGQQPTEEEMRAYLAQLREADPAEVVAQAYTMLGTGAEVKLGRSDARTLIDALAALVEAVDGRLAADLVNRMRSGVHQLQMAQVETEQQAAGASGQGQAEAGGPYHQPSESGPPGEPPPGPPQPGRDAAGDRRMTDRLWIPGRDPRPR